VKKKSVMKQVTCYKNIL